MRLVEQMKFAMTWDKMEENRTKSKNRTIYYKRNIPSWLMNWTIRQEKVIGLTRVRNVLCLLGTCDFNPVVSEDKNVLTTLEIFCTIPRSLKVFSMFPDASAFIGALPCLASKNAYTAPAVKPFFERKMDLFWQELAKSELAKNQEAVKTIFRLLRFVAPDEIMPLFYSSYWRTELEHCLDNHVFCDLKTEEEKRWYCEIMLHTPVIRKTHSDSQRARMITLIMQNKNNDVYLNLLCCDPNMNGLFAVHQIMQMSEGLENPESVASYLQKWNQYFIQEESCEKDRYANHRQRMKRLINLTAYSGGEPRFLKKLDRVVMTATDTELDDILSGSPLQILGRICRCNEVDKITADFPKETSTSVTLDGDVFCVRDFLADAVLKRQKAVLRYLAGRDLTENTVSYLCTEHCKVSRLVYLNAWSAKDINTLAEKDLFSVFDEYGNTILDLAKKFGKNTPYTFQEIQTLQRICATPEGFFQKLTIFFILLSRLRSEEACRRISQFAKYSKQALDDADVSNVVRHLKQGDIPTMVKRIVSVPVTSETAAKIMTTSNNLESVLQTAKTETEILFVLENPALCITGLKEGMKQFLNQDETVLEVKKQLDLPDEFYRINKDTVWKFFLSGNGKYVRAYMHSSVREAFKVVVKAAMCDCLDELRYTDLDKECCMTIRDRMYDHWVHNNAVTISGYKVYEDTSFQGIMNLGAVPTRTCMNYVDGLYRQCLLAYFDGNKKIIYVKKNGTIIARAVIRLTKTANRMKERDEDRLTFTDVAVKQTQTSVQSTPFVETPIIFLERCYSGIQGKKRIEIESAIIRFAMEKAEELGCGYLVSGEYETTIAGSTWGKTLIKAKTPVFITKSKAGEQYLDSFGGVYSNKGSGWHENTYVNAKCFGVRDVIGNAANKQ